jgi:hypothetical protein
VTPPRGHARISVWPSPRFARSSPRLATLAVTVTAVLVAGAISGAAAAPLTVEDCVRIAGERSARVRAAHADVGVIRAQAQQVEAALSTKVSFVGFVAPMFEASGGLGTSEPYRRDLSSWGPYTHGELRVVKPLSTFGRYDAGVTASRERLAVEAERAREIANGVRLEVRRLYGLRLFALSMKPNLENGRSILAEAIKKAEELYAKDTGEVTLPELMRLKYGAGEIERYLRQADDGIALATAALAQSMGLPAEPPLELADAKLPVPADADPPSLAALLQLAREGRPELGQIAHGKAAASAWATAERRANLPVLFAALAAQGNYSPVRPMGLGASLANAYNDYFVGAALGLKLDLDFAAAAARVAEANAKAQWIAENEALAETGIPLQLKKARQELVQHRDLAKIADEQVKSTRKWMTFSAAAYGSGTGEARDVLEGVAAYLLAKKGYYEHLLGAWQAQADLELAAGKR